MLQKHYKAVRKALDRLVKVFNKRVEQVAHLLRLEASAMKRSA
jgi:hypothetical protein